MEKKNFWLGILVIVLVFGMTVVGCDNSSSSGTNSTSNSESVQVTASSDGEISINYNGGVFPIGMNVVVTTNLPAPNNSYTFTDLGTWTITELEPNQEITVTVTAPIQQIDLSTWGNSVYIFVWM
jgi:hypothetical protein